MRCPLVCRRDAVSGRQFLTLLIPERMGRLDMRRYREVHRHRLIADRAGLGVLPWVLFVVAALFCLVTLGLRETAPQVVERNGALAA